MGGTGILNNTIIVKIPCIVQQNMVSPTTQLLQHKENTQQRILIFY